MNIFEIFGLLATSASVRRNSQHAPCFSNRGEISIRDLLAHLLRSDIKTRGKDEGFTKKAQATRVRELGSVSEHVHELLVRERAASEVSPTLHNILAPPTTSSSQSRHSLTLSLPNRCANVQFNGSRFTHLPRSLPSIHNYRDSSHCSLLFIPSDLSAYRSAKTLCLLEKHSHLTRPGDSPSVCCAWPPKYKLQFCSYHP